jgi:Methyltransferase domain
MLIEVDYEYHPANRGRYRHMVKLLSHYEDTYCAFLSSAMSYVSSFEKIPIDADPATVTPFWQNGWIPGLDAVSLYTTVAKYNPRFYVEVGSGNSTKFVRRAIADNGLRTRMISIDPMPRAEINSIVDTAIRKPLEDVSLDTFQPLQSGDVVFLDNSHRAFQNSDVTVFFTEILPVLPSGVIYGLHDIFLPQDYPKEWAPRFYNEQYLLHAYLIGGRGGDDILFPAAYVTEAKEGSKLRDLMNKLFDKPPLSNAGQHGGCFWLSKSPSPSLVSRFTNFLRAKFQNGTAQ